MSADREKWLLVGLLVAAGGMNYADRTAITSVFPLLKSDLGVTDLGLGAIGSLFLWSYGLSSPLAGYIGDRVNRRSLVVWSLSAWSLVILASGFVTAAPQLYGLRILLGLAESFYLPAALALIAAYHPSETLATAQGIHTVGQSLGMIGGGALAGWLGQLYGWRVPMQVLGVAGLLVAAVCHLGLPKKPPRNAVLQPGKSRPLSFPQAAAQLLIIPSFLILALAGVLTAIGTWIFINWMPLYFQQTFHMSLAGAGFFGTSLLSVSAAIANVAGGVLSDVVARKGAHRRMLLQSAMIFCAAPPLLAFAFTPALAVIMVCLFLYSIFRTLADLNLVPLLSHVGGAARASTAYGITNMCNTLSGGLGVFLAGYLKADFGLAGIFAGVAAILVLDGFLLLLGYTRFVRKDLAQARASSP
jgi:MFS transporter, Spinster family, sphingosine-1-phosphate transporter